MADRFVDKESSNDGGLKRPIVYFLGGYHPVNESFIRSPPSNVILRSRVPTEAFDNFERPSQYDPSWSSRKRIADLTFKTVGSPRLVPVLRKYDLIHTNGSIIPLCLTPWVASIENPSAFYGFNEDWHEKKSMRRRLARFLLSPRCKAILPYSNASRDYIFKGLSDWEDDLEKKTHVLYPAIDRYLIYNNQKDKPGKNRTDKVRFLFVGNHFFDKGGREVLRAFQAINKTSACELVVVSSAPAHQQDEFAVMARELKSTSHVRFYPTGIPRAELLDLYRSSNVFVLPSYMDQVPFVLLEAMAAGLPIIGSNSFAIPEMVIDGVNGFNIKSPLLAFPEEKLRTEEHLRFYRKAVLDEKNFDGVVEQLTDAMSKLIASPETIERLGRESLDMVTSGRFSTDSRNETLARIYDDSIKS